MRRATVYLFALLLLASRGISGETVSGDAQISAPALGSTIVIKTTARTAGAIDSLVWNGQEFIDSADHGRQLQSASNFDGGTEFTPETFNPTEAGAMFDGAGPKSSSVLLALKADGRRLETTSQMAFWLRPGEKSGGHFAKNTAACSNHLLKKRVTVGHKDMPNVLEYAVTFTVPAGENHKFAQFESLTGYMPPAFESFYTFDPKTGKAEPLSAGPGEQSRPVIFATKNGTHAMAIYCPQQPSKGFETAGYGRWNFRDHRVVKWNCVFRIRDEHGIKPGDYSYTHFVPIGTLDDCVTALKKLINSGN